MVQITQGGVRLDPGAVERLSSDYHETGVAIMPGFLATPVLDALLRKVAISKFALRKEEYVTGATLFMPASEPALVSLHFILNRRELFDAVARITGVAVPGNFLSRLHRTTPSPGQHIDWHDDRDDFRVLGLNINLSTHAYKGGVLQVRNPERTVVAEIGQMAPGDAFLFRIGNRWQHRLTPVESGERTVAVGWFRSSPDWALVLRSSFQTSQSILATERQ